MEEKSKNYLKILWPYVLALRDVRFAGMVVFGVIVLLITWSGVKVIDTNYGLQKQISQLKQENAVRRLENQNIALKNEYYKTDTYLELQARKSFGLARPGETVLVVSKDAALARLVASPKAKATKTGSAKDNHPFFVQNFESWVDFFLHRQR